MRIIHLIRFDRLHLFGMIAALGLICVLAAPLPTYAASTPPFRVYLTFEDGPTDAYTPEILDILATYRAKATFFIAGFQIKGREALLQREIREGHALGNHLWEESGLYFDAPAEAVRASYLRTEDAMRAALGPDLLPIYAKQTKLFRQPAGGVRPFPETPDVQVITYNWHVSSDDCAKNIDFNNALSFDQQVILNVLSKTRTRNLQYNNVYDFGDGAVVVFHDINRVTARVLPRILGDLQEAGATFLPLPRPEDAVGTMPIHFGERPSGWPGVPGLTLAASMTEMAVARTYPSFQGRIAASNLAANMHMTATGRANGWIRVLYNDQQVWVSGAQIRVIGPIHSLPDATP
jgi:peptidoglycan/xylan/chitin deacetylase (PgdA/CDA1 family)